MCLLYTEGFYSEVKVFEGGRKRHPVSHMPSPNAPSLSFQVVFLGPTSLPCSHTDPTGNSPNIPNPVMLLNVCRSCSLCLSCPPFPCSFSFIKGIISGKCLLTWWRLRSDGATPTLHLQHLLDFIICLCGYYPLARRSSWKCLGPPTSPSPPQPGYYGREGTWMRGESKGSKKERDVFLLYYLCLPLSPSLACTGVLSITI